MSRVPRYEPAHCRPRAAARTPMNAGRYRGRPSVRSMGTGAPPARPSGRTVPVDGRGPPRGEHSVVRRSLRGGRIGRRISIGRLPACNECYRRRCWLSSGVGLTGLNRTAAPTVVRGDSEDRASGVSPADTGDGFRVSVSSRMVPGEVATVCPVGLLERCQNALAGEPCRFTRTAGLRCDAGWVGLVGRASPV